MRSKVLAVSVAVLVVGGVVGCGGDEESGDTKTVTVDKSNDGGSSAPEGPSTGEFIQQADAICSDLNAQAGDLPTDTLPQIEQATEASHAAVSEGIGRLQQLEVPSELQTQFDQFIAALEDQNAVVQQLHDAAASGDVQSAQVLVPDLNQARQRKSDIAIQVGFAECGSK